jgi:homopolymeric O-antigen transport system ATP-binding protein
MSDIAIRVENLGKLYRIGQRQRYKTLRDSLTDAMYAPFRAVRSLLNGQRADASREASNDYIWALKEVSCDINRGDIIGIVGRNGAGKSTLLKILSRITEPTTGEVEIHGRVGSLLEVGTGFHPELTGRENIYLNGAILGMKKAEIDCKFDEMVGFAELEKFIDTPVKHYSSGMYTRLAFAVAAHLEPEILLVDEVLAVGDMAFHRKCLGKMGEVAREGRTVCFVSHNLAAVRRLCLRTIVLDRGLLIGDAPTGDSLRTYNKIMRDNKVNAQTNLKNRLDRCSGAVCFTSILVHDLDGKEKWDYRVGETIRITMSYRIVETVPDLCVYFALHSGFANDVVTTVKYVLSDKPKSSGDCGKAVIELPEILLRPGEYYPYFWLGSIDGRPFDVVEHQNTSFPPILVESDESDPHKTVGYFSVPSRITVSW